MSQRVKIVIIGPKESGKSCLANYMAGARDLVGQAYAPTAALRILEFERNVSETASVSVMQVGEVAFELWDASGDVQYQATWPAIAEDMNGVILVCNTGMEKELEFWWKSFVAPEIQRGRLHENCSLIISHRKIPEHASDNTNKSMAQLPRKLTKIPLVESNLDIPGDMLFREFDRLVARIVQSAATD